MRVTLLLCGAAALAVAAPSPGNAAAPVLMRTTAAANVSVYATGFNNPRGLKFGPDGLLYVAEGGPGGGNSTIGQCEQVPGPVGPYTGAATGGRISKVTPTGARVTVIDSFPSSETSPNQGNLVSGVSDIAFIGTTMYAITAGSGCSHGVPNSVNGVFRVANGRASLVANLSSWEKLHPVADPDPDDFEPDGTWYSMVAVGNALYAAEPNQGQIDRISLNGSITRLVDTSATLGHAQPTALAYQGIVYFGNLGSFPITVGSSQVRGVMPNGKMFTVASGLTTVLGLAFDRRGRMYALENTVHNGFPTPGYGDVVRLTGGRMIIASGLALPTAMTFGPDGALYVSNWGFGPPPSLPNGPGQVLRITVPN